MRLALRGTDKFAGLAIGQGLHDVPLLPEFLAVLECTAVDAHEAGDHTIFVGQVDRLTTRDQDRRPLGCWRGAYTALQREPLQYVPEAAVELWALGW